MRYLATAVLGLTVATLSAQEIVPPVPAHVTVSTSVGPVEAGKTVALFVDVTPKPNIHVYAPGADDYQPVKVTIDRQPGVVARQLHYPKSSLLVTDFEKVPVFEKPFRLTQDVTIEPGDGTRTLTVKGKLDYQACDDNVCYKPATIPVSWTINLK